MPGAYSKPITLARINDIILGSVGRAIPPNETVNHSVRFLSTWSGSDKWFMLIQYVAKLLSVLLRNSKSQALLAERLAKLSSHISDSRTLWRLWGLLPIFQWLTGLERTPPPTRTLLTIERLQALSMLVYYPLEHLSYLASHKIIPLPPAKIASYSIWSVRAWAVYVLLQFVHLREDWKVLKRRERDFERDLIVNSEKEREEEVYKIREEVKRRKQAILNETVVNLGYLPLTIHWSLEQGLFKSDGLVAFFGLVAGLASWRGGWAATAAPI